MREAQHAHTPRSSAASLSRPGGGRAGGGLATEAGHRPTKESRFAYLRESASFSGGSCRIGGKRGPGGSGKIGAGGDKGGAGEKGGSGAKNLAGMAFQTLFGGVSSRVAT